MHQLRNTFKIPGNTICLFAVKIRHDKLQTCTESSIRNRLIVGVSSLDTQTMALTGAFNLVS
jgi:hypothetical protein